MAETLNNMKEVAIFGFLSSIDFKRDPWTIQQIKEGLRPLIGELPGIDLVWFKSQRVSESTGQAETVEAPSSITVFYSTDDATSNKVHAGNVTFML